MTQRYSSLIVDLFFWLQAYLIMLFSCKNIALKTSIFVFYPKTTQHQQKNKQLILNENIAIDVK
ncbi:hypothetical protein OM33_05565 [Pseudoalteromonas piratica]|uniref:Uncharacterized protein n=1 Tax=Pseudoalteromonas piratica TaxID=1348114 RepID=A0A0A7EFA8_9GAMM|nr:hypothetical protein OM33_05565 [Pseudoalteromonas piratica]